MPDATTRFSERVENYRRYRPGYPKELIEFLVTQCGLSPESAIADIGSGTALLSQAFLNAGFRVIGIEPNREMREAGDRVLAGCARFRSVNAMAEQTTLADASIDLIVAGQAFHWFDVERTRAEWNRVLRPKGAIALIWNERSHRSPFMREVGQMIDRWATYRDPHGSIREAGQSRIAGFFAPAPYRVEEFPNNQTFDYKGLLGRIASSSYLPQEGDPEFEAMAGELCVIFDNWQQDSEVVFEYRTRVYYSSRDY